MKQLVKLAVAAAVLSGGAAHAANINSLGGTAASDVILFVTNATDTSFYARNTGITLDQLGTSSTTTQSSVALDGAQTTASPGSFTLNSALNLSADPTLATFLTNNPGSQWTILAVNGTGSGVAPGNKFIASTFPAATGIPIGVSTSAVSGAANTLINFFIEENGVTWPVNTTEGWGKGGVYGAQAASAGNIATDANAVGVATNTYLLSTNNKQKPIELVSTNKLTLNTDGSLSVSAVPIPAALWLFGSGLLGLAGVGRRRAAA